MKWFTVNPFASYPLRMKRRFPVAIFDFDGTVSLIREGWSRIMADRGMESMPGADEPVRDHLEREMLALSGRPSIVQMQKLAEEIRSRGFSSPSPEQLHADFEARLFERIKDRKLRLANSSDSPAQWAVPGTHDFLTALKALGITLYLVSGTDMPDVEQEMALLDLTRFFEPTIYAPIDRSGSFHKRDAIAAIMRTHQLKGSQIIGFGDGYSETVEVKAIGGTAVGVASVEVGKSGRNPMKETMLRSLGANPIVAHYLDNSPLLALFDGTL